MKNTLNNTKTNSNNIFENIRNGMVNAMTNAKTGVGNVLERMKGFFNFQWHLPHIKLPHFNGACGRFLGLSFYAQRW